MIYETREALSDFFGGDGPEQVVFTPNATAALNTVIQGILNPGDRAVTTAMEHNSVLRPLYRMEKQGVSLCVVPADEKGCPFHGKAGAGAETGDKGSVLYSRF